MPWPNKLFSSRAPAIQHQQHLSYPFLESNADGELVIRNLPLFFVDVLLLVPKILESPDEALKDQLIGASYPDDTQKEEEWRKFSHPELFALFASRSEILRSDLANLEIEDLSNPSNPDQDFLLTRGFKIRIPQANLAAWIASLNAARLMLAYSNNIGDSEMAGDANFEDPSEQDLALIKIDLLGSIQEMLVAAGSASDS